AIDSRHIDLRLRTSELVHIARGEAVKGTTAGQQLCGGLVMRRFEGKVALVTAAAQGIGQAVVRRIAAEGGAVVITDLQQDAVTALAGELGSEHALGVKVDVTSRADIDAAVAAAV